MIAEYCRFREIA